VTPLEFREDLGIHKTRMNGLSCGEESMTICSAVLIQYQRVTDRRSDGRTDVQPISITCFSIADARKNRQELLSRGQIQKVELGETRGLGDGSPPLPVGSRSKAPAGGLGDDPSTYSVPQKLKRLYVRRLC